MIMRISIKTRFRNLWEGTACDAPTTSYSCPYHTIFTSYSCPYDIRFMSLFQCQAGEGGEVAGGGEETLGGDGADGFDGLGERDGAAVVEGAAAHGECDLLGIYRADGQLADELAFGRLKLAFRQGR